MIAGTALYVTHLCELCKDPGIARLVTHILITFTHMKKKKEKGIWRLGSVVLDSSSWVLYKYKYTDRNVFV